MHLYAMDEGKYSKRNSISPYEAEHTFSTPSLCICSMPNIIMTSNIMPSNTTYPTIIHMPDFIVYIELDSTRPGTGRRIQLRISLNIPCKEIQ